MDLLIDVREREGLEEKAQAGDVRHGYVGLRSKGTDTHLTPHTPQSTAPHPHIHTHEPGPRTRGPVLWPRRAPRRDSYRRRGASHPPTPSPPPPPPPVPPPLTTTHPLSMFRWHRATPRPPCVSGSGASSGSLGVHRDALFPHPFPPCGPTSFSTSPSVPPLRAHLRYRIRNAGRPQV